MRPAAAYLHDRGDRANPKCDDYMWSLLCNLPPVCVLNAPVIATIAERCCVDPRTGEYSVNHLRAITVAGFLAATVPPAAAAIFRALALRFPYPVYAKWADTYRKETGVRISFQSIGSGGGIKEIEAKTVTFGATDAPLMGAELDKFGLVQVPMVMGGIVPVVNIDGVAPGDLFLDRPTMAAIVSAR